MLLSSNNLLLEILYLWTLSQTDWSFWKKEGNCHLSYFGTILIPILYIRYKILFPGDILLSNFPLPLNKTYR